MRFISHSLEPGDMYTSVFVYTTASVTSATPRADLRFTGVVAIRPLVEKGQRFQRYWRLYEMATAPVAR